MKKVMILAVAAALIGLAAPNTMAQVPGSSQPSSTPSQQQEDDLEKQTPSSTTQPGTSGSSGDYGTSGSQSGSQTGTSGTSAIEYKDEVKTADLPEAITRSINEKYPGYKTEKVFRGSDGTYKVKLSKGEEMQTLFLDARGEVVKMKK